MTSTQLFLTLLGDVKNANFDELKWPGEGTFEVVVGAVLVQNTAWKNVEKALENLRRAGRLNLEGILELSNSQLAELIKPSGFYNTKAKRLGGLCVAIAAEFGDFESFKEQVSREWLLAVKGIGAETCDAILAYACGRAVMVVDAYALRVLGHLGYEFECYEEAQEWLAGLDYDEIYEVLDAEKFDEAEILRLYHVLIIEFCKANFRGKILSEQGRAVLSMLE